jgi:5'(3')-deoxyribonucleotidase
MVTSNKKLIKGDVLRDDGVHNLLEGDYKKILVSTPYNESFDAEANNIIRVKNWKEIEVALTQMGAL